MVKNRKQLDRLARFLEAMLEHPAKLREDGSYEIDQTVLDTDGTITWGKKTKPGLIDLVSWEAQTEGFTPANPEAEPSKPDAQPEPDKTESRCEAEEHGLVLSIYAGDEPEATFEKLKILVNARAVIIRKACRAGQTVASYERGWDIKPVDANTDFALDLFLHNENY